MWAAGLESRCRRFKDVDMQTYMLPKVRYTRLARRAIPRSESDERQRRRSFCIIAVALSWSISVELRERGIEYEWPALCCQLVLVCF